MITNAIIFSPRTQGYDHLILCTADKQGHTQAVAGPGLFHQPWGVSWHCSDTWLHCVLRPSVAWIPAPFAAPAGSGRSVAKYAESTVRWVNREEEEDKDGSSFWRGKRSLFRASSWNFACAAQELGDLGKSFSLSGPQFLIYKMRDCHDGLSNFDIQRLQVL